MGKVVRLATRAIFSESSSLSMALMRRMAVGVSRSSLIWKGDDRYYRLILLVVIVMIARFALRFRFGTESLNVRISDRDPLTRERIDKHLDRYGHLFRAFVLKRRLTRAEVWPKMVVMDGLPSEEQPHLATQGLFSMKKSMREEVMAAISKNDPSQINSAFIISLFSEDHFKEMMDSYLGKVLVCGKAPHSQHQQEYSQIEQRVLDLYRVFYFGEGSSSLEREIQQAYLSAKQFKHLRSQAQKRINKNDYEACKWTEQDQRMLEEKLNWQIVDSNLTDLNYRTYFAPLLYASRLDSRRKFEQLYSSWNFLDALKFNWVTARYYDPASRHYYDWVQQKLFVRIMNHLRSQEFTACLNIPHDYMIEAQLIQIHFWLVIDRLRKINTTGSLVLARRLAFTLNLEIVRSSRSVNVKKSNILQASLERMLETNNTILQLHFHRSELTKDNPYKGVDALVWSIAFAEKVHRYADEVYLFGEYLVRNFEHLQRHTYEDLVNGVVEFDPYLVDTRYRQKIEAINPPLPAAEFQKQFNSNSSKKDYYYSRVQEEMEALMPIEKQYTPSSVDTRFSLGEFLQPFRNLRVKYFSLKTMDHFSKMEERKKQNQEMDRKGTWKSQADSVRQVSQDFAAIHSIRNQRRSRNQGPQPPQS